VKLTEHFSLEELTFSEIAERNGWDNTPNDHELENLKRLAEFLEDVKQALRGKPIIISSGFRSKKTNDGVGSRDSSQHRIGAAVDFRVPELTPDQVVKAIIASDLQYDQVIREFDRWTHLSIPNTVDAKPRKQALIIDKSGTRAFV
jgi:zinc D-Ala-D-Ala carboxypeptidase